MTDRGPSGADDSIHRSRLTDDLIVGATQTIQVTRTHLEMNSEPTSVPPAPPAIPHAIMRAHNPTVSFYRFLYHNVGETYLWWERRAISDSQLGEIISDESVEVMVFYVEGTPAGYYELVTYNEKNEVDIGYFGLLPEFVGRKLGAYLLRVAIDDAWSRKPNRVTVNTCTLDHPNALPNYQRAGFAPYDQDTFEIEDPRLAGYF